MVSVSWLLQYVRAEQLCNISHVHTHKHHTAFTINFQYRLYRNTHKIIPGFFKAILFVRNNPFRKVLILSVQSFSWFHVRTLTQYYAVLWLIIASKLWTGLHTYCVFTRHSTCMYNTSGRTEVGRGACRCLERRQCREMPTRSIATARTAAAIAMTCDGMRRTAKTIEVWKFYKFKQRGMSSRAKMNTLQLQAVGRVVTVLSITLAAVRWRKKFFLARNSIVGLVVQYTRESHRKNTTKSF